MDITSLLKVSIIIITYNRPNDLNETLPTIFAQNYPIHEVVIVDDSSDERTKKISEQFQSIFPLLAWHRNTGISSIPDARNFGIELVTGDIICFLDDDVTLQENYLENIVKVFKDNPKALGVTGYDETPSVSTKYVNAFFRLMAFSHMRKDQALVLPSVRIVSPHPLTKTISCQRFIGFNMAFKKDVFSEFRFTPAPSGHFALHDDIEFSFQIYKKHPGSLLATPDAIIKHRASPTSRRTTYKIFRDHRWHEWRFFKNYIDKSAYNVIYFFYSRITNTFIELYFSLKQQTNLQEKPISDYLFESLYLGRKEKK